MKGVVIFILCVTVVTRTEFKDFERKDLFVDAEVLLEKYKNTVATLLAKASAQFVEKHDDLLKHGVALFTLTSRVVMNAQREFIGQLEELSKSATDVNLDPNPCTVSPYQHLGYLPNETVVQCSTCVDTVTRETDHNLRLAFSSFDNVNETVQQYADRIEKCRENNEGNCILSVITHMAVQNELLPDVMEGEIEEVVNQFANLDLYFQDCFTSPTQQFNILGNNLVQTARKCIEMLINGSKSHTLENLV